MSTQNQISIEVPASVIEAALNHLKECKASLAPYLKGLSDEDRKSLFKMGNKTVATVQKTKSYIETNPEFIPAYMDKVEFFKDEAIVAQFNPLANLAEQLTRDLEDTVMLAGSDALRAAMLYYGQVKEADHKGIVTAKPIYDDLSARFAKGSPKQQNKI